jgi:hypothetical protein
MRKVKLARFSQRGTSLLNAAKRPCRVHVSSVAALVIVIFRTPTPPIRQSKCRARSPDLRPNAMNL